MSRPVEAGFDAIEYGTEAATRPARVLDYPGLLARGPGKGKGRRRAASPSLKTARAVVLYDSDDDRIREYAGVFARQMTKMRSKQIKDHLIAAISEADMVAALQRYERIGELVLWYHGFPGGLIVGSDAVDLEGIAAFKKGYRPSITKIEFPSCNVGVGADKLVKFGDLFKASTIKAWNLSRFNQPIDVTLPDEGSVAIFAEQMAPVEPWVAQGSPKIASLKPGEHRIWLECFRNGLGGPNIVDDLNNLDLPLMRRQSIPLESATEVRVARSGVQTLTNKYRGSPVRPLDRVIINL